MLLRGAWLTCLNLDRHVCDDPSEQTSSFLSQSNSTQTYHIAEVLGKHPEAVPRAAKVRLQRGVGMDGSETLPAWDVVNHTARSNTLGMQP